MKRGLKKKNILYIFNDILWGGAAQSLLDMLKELKKEVNPVVVMPEAVSDEVINKFRDLNICCYKICFSIDFINIGGETEGKKNAEFKQSYEAALNLLPIVNRENIEIIHINSSISYFAAITALMANVPYVWHIRELMEEHYGCEFLNKELKQKLYIQADRLITISNYVQKLYSEKYTINSQKLYDGLEIGRFKLDIKKRRDFKNIFLMVAEITPAKGQIDAIKAIEVLINKGYSDIKLIIIGARRNKYVWALKKYLKIKGLGRHISILPYQDDLLEFQRMSSYALTCSQNEALGRVSIEAMLAGNLVIGARSGGTIEIIGENEERGFLYELHNSKDLANTMIRAMESSKDLKYKKIKDAQKYVENVFNSITYSKKLLELYDSVIVSYEQKDQNELLNSLEKNYKSIIYKMVSDRSDFDIRLRKSQLAFTIAERWLEIKQKGHNLQEYFIRHNFSEIAIYGMALLGCRLYDELEDGSIIIKYIIDRSPDGMEKVLNFELLKDTLEVDVIVVTVVAAEKQIIREIQQMGYKNVIGISDILDDFYMFL